MESRVVVGGQIGELREGLGDQTRGGSRGVALLISEFWSGDFHGFLQFVPS